MGGFADNASRQLAAGGQFSWSQAGRAALVSGTIGGATGGVFYGVGQLLGMAGSAGGPSLAALTIGGQTRQLAAAGDATWALGASSGIAGSLAGTVFSVNGNDPRAVSDFVSSGARIHGPRGIGASELTSQHHIATRYGFWGRQFRRMFQQAGMTIENKMNLIAVSGHQAPHGWYNLMVYQRLAAATEGLAPGTQAYSTAFRSELLRLRVDVLRQGPGGLYDLLTSPASALERTLARAAFYTR